MGSCQCSGAREEKGEGGGVEEEEEAPNSTSCSLCEGYIVVEIWQCVIREDLKPCLSLYSTGHPGIYSTQV